MNFLYDILVVSIELLDISFEKNIRIESHHLAEETGNVFDQLEYTSIKYTSRVVLGVEGTEMNHRNLILKVLRI